MASEKVKIICNVFEWSWRFYLENHNVTGLLTISQDIENIMNVYTCVCMNIFVLLYADDTVLMAETPWRPSKTTKYCSWLLLGLEIKSKYRQN